MAALIESLKEAAREDQYMSAGVRNVHGHLKAAQRFLGTLWIVALFRLFHHTVNELLDLNRCKDVGRFFLHSISSNSSSITMCAQ